MIDFEMPISRRAAVLGGLGLVASIPMTALADTVAKVGYKADGSAYQGLVTMHGKTYLYEGGVLFKGGQKEYKGSRYFSTSDGHMAVNEDVKWTDGTTHHYGSDGLLNDKPKLTELNNSSFKDGWYTLLCKSGNRSLDVAGARTTNGTVIQLHDSNNSQAQKWRIMWDKSVNAFRIETSANLIEAGTPGDKKVGQGVFLWTEAWKSDGKAYTNQRWKLFKTDSGHLLIVNADNGLTLTAKQNANAAKITLETQTIADNQLWSFKSTPSWSGWWQDSDGKWHVNDPANGMMVKNSKRVDPVYKNGQGVNDGWGSIYDFDVSGNAMWHLPTFADLPNGAHGDVTVPNITQGDRRQRTITYALSRVGCSYALGNTPHQFVCDGLTEWSYEKGTGEGVGAADGQWQLIKARDNAVDPWKRSLDKLKPGDFVFFGAECLTYYDGALGANGWPNYHAGIYYANGKMINSRSATGVTTETSVAAYSGKGSTGDGTNGMGWQYLGGGSPYAWDTSHFGVPHM